MKLTAPPINDISTDLDEPPPLASGKPYPKRFVRVVQRHYAWLKPLRLDRPVAEVLGAAERTARGMERWRVDHVSADEGVIQGVAVTGLLRFRDDICIRLRAAGDGTRVDMRSASRIGRGDFGANAERIRAFFEALERRLRR